MEIYRNHAEEIDAARAWEDERRAMEIEAVTAASAKLGAIIAAILLFAAIAAAVIGIARFAISEVKAMPKHIEGFK